MNAWGQMTMGIPRPKNEAETKAQATLDGMRQAIWHGQRDSALIKNALLAAEYAGMSGEDKYTLLAYHALVALEELYGEHLKWISLSPRPPWMIGSMADTNEVGTKDASP